MYFGGMQVPLRRRLAAALILLPLLMSGTPGESAPVDGYQIVAKFPHSTESYTEGFFYLNGLFYEGTGLEGDSAVLVIQPKTGAVVQRHDLAPEYFGEGIVDWGANIYEWTWQSHIGFVY